MRVVFMGTPEFAVPSLRALAHDTEVVAVYSRPDAASGRGGRVRPSPVKVAALELGLCVMQPRTLRDEAAVAEFASLEADLAVVAAYGLILPRAALEAARLGAVNVHASLLPRWRGAAPIQRGILAGDEFGGVSIMRMEEGLDTGPYCAQASLPFGEMSASQATAAIAELGARTLIEALPSIADGSASWTVQDESLVTYAEKLSKDDVALDRSLQAAEALRRVRASGPTAPCRIRIGERALTVIEAALAEDPAPKPGGVSLDRAGVVLGFASGALVVTRVKPEGKSEMDAAAWERGVRDFVELEWESAR